MATVRMTLDIRTELAPGAIFNRVSTACERDDQFDTVARIVAGHAELVDEPEVADAAGR